MTWWSPRRFRSPTSRRARPQRRLWTRENISDETLEFLRGRPAANPELEPSLYHASPRDPIWEYVLSAWQAEECMDAMNGRVAVVGHSHVALWFQRDPEGELDGGQARAGSEADASHRRVARSTPAASGQPRDGDPRAAWLLLDTEGWTASWRRVEYPIDEAAGAIEKAGLPRMLAERLYSGQ